VVVFVSVAYSQPCRKPFPQHSLYYPGTILPSQISRKAMDDSVRSFYDQWKSRYINNNCGVNQYYIWFEEGRKQSVSEGQGYGMVIVAMMAGYDTAAHSIYDGLFRYCQAHPSNNHPALMAWAQTGDCKDLDGSSAADGDFDIAYSLLLADAQWGSAGGINYMREAKTKIAALMQLEINPKNYTIILSDDILADSQDYFDMRTSDFMPAHCKAFEWVTNDSSWRKVVDNNYNLFKMLDRIYSNVGLMPDFIQYRNHKLQPAVPRYLESRYDGQYNYNACRVPWRIGTDYLLHGDPRAMEMLRKLNAWIRMTTNNEPDNISAGYSLEGDDLPGRNFEALSFICPFAVAAMSDSVNQRWLNDLWDYIIHFDMDAFDYYDNTIKLQNILILSGNYWDPKKK
jgi:endoglucanase